MNGPISARYRQDINIPRFEPFSHSFEIINILRRLTTRLIPDNKSHVIQPIGIFFIFL